MHTATQAQDAVQVGRDALSELGFLFAAIRLASSNGGAVHVLAQIGERSAQQWAEAHAAEGRALVEAVQREALA